MNLSLSDIEQMVQLVSQVGDPTSGLPLAARKERLLEGTAALIDADMWMWNLSVLNPERAADIMASHSVSGGWRNDQEMAAAVRQLTDPKFGTEFGGPVQAAVVSERYRTFLRQELISDERWLSVGATWREVGFNSSILSVYPLDSGVFSGVGFHRRVGRPDFSERERLIVHVLFQQVDWLHREGTQLPANRYVVQLSPRQRNVLIFLLGGDSRKEIARKLGLSEHTVGDYLKEIYKRFSVNSRAELLSQFIAGSADPDT